MKRDFYCGVFFFCFGLILLYVSRNFILDLDRYSRMGPKFFPTLFSVVTTILGALLMLQTFVQRGSWKKETQVQIINVKEEFPIFITCIIMVVACILFTYFRYLISMPIAATAMLVFYKTKKWHYYVIMYAFSIIFYYIFVKLMYVQL